MTSPILALRAALRSALLADADLVERLGGARVWDQPPQGTSPPYLLFAEAEARDWSDADVAGHRHALALVAWSQQAGDAEALGIVERAALLLDGAEPAVEGHRLLLLRVSAQEAWRPDRQGLRRAVLRLTALTEPA
ncbi:DUF3168 domain-containing protein [uncultured Alsobacter sp.]|uniref:DUF3168 domain-containing protein n=1 Tax=uncultured Alsobacter sp. TaxID=1748258 RepID=UPI0025D3F749|nr:DUF3168 domain-containing protein [uncultured Alsobacter sp.]